MAIRLLDELDTETEKISTSDKKGIRFLTPEESVFEQSPVSDEVQPIPEQTQGVLSRVKDVFTGESRTTPELEELRTIGDLPELNELSIAGLKSAFSTLTSDPEEAVQVLQANFPKIEARTDSKGNFIIKSGISGEEFAVNKPGLDIRDIVRGGVVASLFSPVGRAATLPLKVGGAALTQAGLESAQKAVGGEFDVEQVPLAGATELVAPGLGRAVRSVAPLRATDAPLSAAQRSVQSAEQAGITPLTSDITPPQTFAGRTIQAVSERIPLVGTGPLRVRQQSQRAEAVKNIFRDFGADETAQVIDSVTSDFLEKRGKSLIKNTNLKNDVIEKLSDKGSVNVQKTIETIDSEVARLNSLRTRGVQSVIEIFEDFKSAFENQNLTNIELLRSQLGEQLKDPNLASVRNTGEKSAAKIYKTLRDDMGQFIKETGDKRDFAKWKIANRNLSKMVNELQIPVLKSVLKRGEDTPEVIRRLLFSQKPSEIKMLYKGLSPEGRSNAKTAIFQEMVQKSGGIENVTPEKFVRQVKKFEKSTGVFLNKQDKQVVEGLVKALELTKRASEANVKPPTGAEVTAFVAPSAISFLLGGSPVGLAVTGGLASATRIFESKPARNLLLKLRNAPANKQKDILNKLTPLLQGVRETGS